MTELGDEKDFFQGLSVGVRVWPCSLWRNEWRERFSPSEMGCGELLSIDQSALVEGELTSILRAGVNALVTGTFGANAIVMKHYGAQAKVGIANRESARIATEVIHNQRHDDPKPLVIGSIGPTTCLLSLNQCKRELVKAAYLEQVEALWGAGVRAFHIEGCRDPKNAYCALESLHELESQTGTPLLRFLTVRAEPDGTLLLGTQLGDFWNTVREFRPQAFGVVGQNEGVEAFLRAVSDRVDIPLIAMVDIRALNSPEMEMLHTPGSFASCLLDLTARFNLRIVGPGVEPDPIFLLSLGRALASAGL